MTASTTRWLIHRFIDLNATLICVPAARALEVAEVESAAPYDIEGVKYLDEGKFCSFDAILNIHKHDTGGRS
jgi:hypothetical protein